MKNFKKENGAITIITLVSILFMVSFLISSYILISNKVKAQKEIINETRDIYESKSDMEEIYNSYFNNSNVIPIYTAEQLVRIGSGDIYQIGNKYYEFSKDSTYMLMNDISFDANDISYLDGKDWIPIGRTNINFEGNGKEITVKILSGEIIIYNKENEYKYAFPENKYKRVEYIEATGTQRINTGIIVDDTTEFYLKCSFKSSVEQWNGVGNADATRFMIGIYQNRFSSSICKTKNTSIAIDYDIHEFLLSNKDLAFYIDGEKVTEYEQRAVQPYRITINIGARNGGTWYYCNEKIYSSKIYQNDMLVKDFIPCYRISDGIGGMYDIIDNVFYTNIGTGEFLIGPEVFE